MTMAPRRREPGLCRRLAPPGDGRAWRAALTLAVLATLAGPGDAQGQVAIGLAPLAPADEALLTLPAAACPDHLEWHTGLLYDYARDVLIGTGPSGEIVRPVADRVTAQLQASLGLFRVVDVGASLPIALSQSAERYAWSGDPGGAGVGDLRLLARAAVLRRARQPGLGLATLVELTIPTATGTRLMGEPSVTVTPWLLLDWRTASGLLAALRVGYLVRPAGRFEDLRFDDEVRAGLGAELPLGGRHLSALAELTGGVGLGGASSAQRRLPLEAAGAVRWRSPAGVTVTVGAGSGLSEGYGAPSARVFVALALGPGRPSGEVEPEALPPRVLAAGAEPGPIAAPAVAPVRLSDTAFDRAVDDQPDADRDGLVPPADACPAEPEDADGFADTDGCPDPDNDGDGVADVEDRCQGEAEVVNGVDDGDGCADQGPASVTVTPEQIHLGQRLQFATGSAEVQPESQDVLAQVAAVLKATPSIRYVRVDGHTDDVGDREQNVDLSLRRAERVVAILVGHGVEASRLEAKGFGPTVPLASNDTDEGRAANRRVEFTVRSGGEGGAP